jgi:hypothetical protein
LLSGAVVAIISSVDSSNTNQQSPLLTVVLLVFIVSLSTVLCQILVSVILNTEEIKSIRFTNSVIKMPTSHHDIYSKLEKIVDSGNKITLKIICYGTSGYSGIVQKVYELGCPERIKIHMVIYNPQSSTHFNESDRTTIEKIKTAACSDNIIFYDSEILPSMRSCIVYNSNNEAIWCCLHTYCYRDLWRTASYDKSPIICAKEDNPITNDLVKLIEAEYKRLGGK